MEEFKIHVTEVLTRHASAILLDPEWGLPASRRVATNRGTAARLREDRLRQDRTGRLPDLLDEWSVRRLKEAGADCIKILLYYTPDDPKDVNDKKHAWVERIGDECRGNDIPFFLEFVGYEEGADEKGLEFAKKKPRIVTESMREFTKDRYGVDVMKVEMPINMKFVEGTKIVRRAEGLLEAGGRWISSGGRPMSRRGRSSTSRPASATRNSPNRWSSRRRPARGSQACCAAGRPGRTAFPSTRSRAARRFVPWLESEGVKNIENVNARLKAARPWFEFYGAASADALGVESSLLLAQDLDAADAPERRCHPSRGRGSSRCRAPRCRSA